MYKAHPASTIHTSQRWWLTLPFLLAIGMLIFQAWAVYLNFTYPYDGIVGFYSSGLITSVSLNSPSGGKLRPGDQISAVDGVPLSKALPFYANKKVGEPVTFLIMRGVDSLQVTITPINPPLPELLSRLASLLIAFIFWIAGLGVQTLSPADRAARIFFLFCMVSTMLLTTGAVSYNGPVWFSDLLGALIFFLGPLATHFHLYFPQTSQFKSQKYGLAVLYGIASIGAGAYLARWFLNDRSNPIFNLIATGGLAFLAINLLIVGIILAYTYRQNRSTGVRSKIRIVVLGGVISSALFVSLSILPEVLIGKTFVPYTYSFFFIAVVPLTYGYAIFRHRLVQIDRHISRGATIILVYSFLAGFNLLLNTVLHSWLPSDPTAEPVINTILMIILATIFVPLSQQVQRLVDTVFYGGWYDYRSAILQITRGLEQVTDLNILAETISQRLARTLRLEETCVFLRDLDGNYSVITATQSPNRDLSKDPGLMPADSLTYLMKVGNVERTALIQKLAEVSLTPEEYQLLTSEQKYNYVTVIGHGQLLGLIGLGPKYGGDVFSGEDMDILRVVASQTAPLIENIHLVTRLKRNAEVLAQRVADRTEQLYNEKERLKAILESVGDGVFVTDLNWNVLTANAAFENQFGYQPEEIIGQDIWSLIDVDRLEHILQKINSTVTKGNVWRGELSSRGREGHSYDIQLAIAPLRDQNMQMIGYVGSQRDITRQKELDRLKDRLIFDVSHELRTPVTNLNLYLELLENGRPEKRVGYLAVLKSETNRLIEMIESILDLSRLDMWKSKKLELVPVDIRDIADQVISAYRPLAENAGLELLSEVSPDLPDVQGEPNQLARLITNLLSNAIRYTPGGQVCVRLSQDGSYICVQVEDTGIGVEPEDLPHLFDRFYRGKQVSQSKIPGTGLGLSVVKEIVEIHAGRIAVISEVGKGTTFSVWLPVQNGV